MSTRSRGCLNAKASLRPLEIRLHGGVHDSLMDAKATDLRLTTEDLAWLLKLRGAKAANRLSADIRTGVVRKLKTRACAEAGTDGCALTRVTRPGPSAGLARPLSGAENAAEIFGRPTP